MKPYRLHPGATADLMTAAAYYEVQSWSLAERFIAEMKRLVDDVCAKPGAFRLFGQTTRRHFGKRFPYAVIYIQEPDYVLILAFAHFKRAPGYWGARLRLKRP